MEVCIIGGGLCGIVSSRVALDHGLIPFVLNKSSKIGGLWNPEAPGMSTWDSLHLNGSKHIAAFSDFLWPTTDEMFPPGSQFKNYLLNYVKKHSLSQYFHNNCTVTLVQRQHPGYLVTWNSGTNSQSKYFEFVIVANGRFNQPYKNIPIKKDFTSKVIYSGEYKEPSIFTGKKVVIVGKSVSGSEIALDAIKTAEKVTQVWRSKWIILPKNLIGLPYDFYFNKIENFSQYRHFVNFPDVVTQNQARLLKFVGNPGNILKEWEISEKELEDRGQHGQHACSNAYIDAVKSNKIHCVQGNAKYLTKNCVHLESGEELEADIVVICTGYTVNFDYLSEEIKGIIEYEGKNKLLPFVAYRRVLHPKLPGLGFIGFLFGAAGRYELQVEIAMRKFCGKLQVSDQELWQGVNMEQWMRISLKDNYAAYDPFGYLKECQRILRTPLNLDLLKGKHNFSGGIYAPYFLFSDRKGQDEICQEYIKELKSRYPKL
jgi:dimethylaniline monooxygenase (N-oxide forming)